MSKGMKVLLIVVVVLAILYFVTKSKQAATPQPTTLAGIWQSIKNTIGI
jgi:hypothetical protein